MGDVGQRACDLPRHRRRLAALGRLVAVRNRLPDRDSGRSRPGLVRAGDELIAACEQLARAGAECATALAAGQYPGPAERAGAALQRFRAAL
ncbi:hypothetical protein [Enterovirga sp. CN4-39]|uniref:hypothetical protein n=1 Tax=Enterovirga sp. CN4-39 TaxID=3400910 RepID=UPI003C101DF2